jgi:hypothetical protein
MFWNASSVFCWQGWPLTLFLRRRYIQRCKLKSYLSLTIKESA